MDCCCSAAKNKVIKGYGHTENKPSTITPVSHEIY